MASNSSNSTNSLRILEDGELSNSSTENSNLDFKSMDFKNLSTYSNKLLSNDQSLALIDSERSLFDIFTMDCRESGQQPSNDCQKSINQSKTKPKNRTIFTGWSDQLIREQSKQKKQKHLPNKVAEKKIVKEDLRIKLEKSKMLNFVSDISFCLREKRKDIVYKIVEACGIKLSSELCTEAIQIYSTTGMQTPNGKQRTLGGCFFQIVKLKGNLSESQKKIIFNEPTSQFSKKKKQAKNARTKAKKQLKTQNQLELINLFQEMNLNINVSVRLK